MQKQHRRISRQGALKLAVLGYSLIMVFVRYCNPKAINLIVFPALIWLCWVILPCGTECWAAEQAQKQRSAFLAGCQVNSSSFSTWHMKDSQWTWPRTSVHRGGPTPKRASWRVDLNPLKMWGLRNGFYLTTARKFLVVPLPYSKAFSCFLPIRNSWRHLRHSGGPEVQLWPKIESLTSPNCAWSVSAWWRKKLTVWEPSSPDGQMPPQREPLAGYVGNAIFIVYIYIMLLLSFIHIWQAQGLFLSRYLGFDPGYVQ